MRDNMENLKDKSSLDFTNPTHVNTVPAQAVRLKGEKVAEEVRKDNMNTSGPESNEPEYSLNDDRRVKVLSPGAMVAKRFFRNGVAVFGMIVLIAMFVFSFIGGIISPYEQDEKFYTTEYQLKEYAGVTKNEELRFATAPDQEFGGAVQAKTVLAIKQNASEFVYRDVTYKVTKEGENLHSVSLNGTMIGIAYTDIVSTTVAGATISFDFQYNALKAYGSNDSGFQADGQSYQMDGATVLASDGSEVAFISQYVVQSVMPDIFLTRDFKEAAVAAVESNTTEFKYTSEEGEHDYVIAYDPAAKVWSIQQETETYVFDTYSYPSKEHPLGTDKNGMDMLTRLMYGGRVSLVIGFIVVAISAFLGVIMGGISGYFGGWIDNLIMRAVDVFYCIPSTPILIILGAAMDAMRVDPTIRMLYLMLILGFLGWAGIARLVRGQILSLREQEFMTATEACGISVSRRIFRHLIPNVIPQLIVTCTMSLGSTILTEATLSFLGLGVKFPFASWGNIINDVNNTYVLTNYWFIWIPAGVCLLMTVLAFNLVGDGLRDAFDPRMKR